MLLLFVVLDDGVCIFGVFNIIVVIVVGVVMVVVNVLVFALVVVVLVVRVSCLVVAVVVVGVRYGCIPCCRFCCRGWLPSLSLLLCYNRCIYNIGLYKNMLRGYCE